MRYNEMKLSGFASAIFLVCLSMQMVTGKVITCYFESWTTYDPGDGAFNVEDIDPHLCTHLIYTFAGLDESTNEIYSIDPYCDLDDDYGMGGFRRFNELRTVNTDLHTTLSIGGWNEGSTKYSNMAKDANKRATFVKSVVAFLKKYDFQGLDLDWEYPTQREGDPADKDNYVLLLKELKEAFEPEGLTLTAAVSAGYATIDAAYDVPEVSKYLDYIHVMTYDFHGDWDTQTGHNAPMNAQGNEDPNFSVTYAINYWLEKGAPANKLVMGIPFYGRSFTLSDTSNAGIGAPITGPGDAGPYSQEAGYLNYDELCLQLSEGGWTVTNDPIAEAPYASKDNQWVGYDTTDSIATKLAFAESKGIAGVMVWPIDGDDFRGKCGPVYPLIKALQ